MRKSLLATAAAIALIAGTGMASAEGAREQPAAKSGQSEMQKSGPSDMHRGADTKGGAATKSQPQTTGSGANEMKSEPKAQTKGSADMKSGTDTKAGGKAEMNNKAKPSTTGAGSSEKADTKANEKAGTAEKSGSRSKSTTTGAGPSESGKSGEMKSGTDTRSSQGSQAPGARPSQGAQSPSSTQTGQSPSSAQGTSSSTTAQGSAGSQGGSVNLTSEQKTQIRTTVLQSSSAPKVSRSEVNFNIGVGTVVPRSVHVVEVPDTIVRIHPAWRGYRYFVVDEEIIIVEPRTLKIVAVLTV
jgi:hypothetical protein